MENKYYAKDRWLPVIQAEGLLINNPCATAIGARSGPLS